MSFQNAFVKDALRDIMKEIKGVREDVRQLAIDMKEKPEKVAVKSLPTTPDFTVSTGSFGTDGITVSTGPGTEKEQAMRARMAKAREARAAKRRTT